MSDFTTNAQPGNTTSNKDICEGNARFAYLRKQIISANLKLLLYADVSQCTCVLKTIKK